jgi:alpha-L-rhamnosidase
MALYYDIVDDREKVKVLNSLVQCVKKTNYHLTTGEVALKPLFMSLAENGYNDIVYRMATAEDMPSYGYFVRQGATSLPEFWDMRASHNHCMMGHLDEWFYSQLGGIRNEGVAYDSITIAPYFAPDLSWVKTHISTVRGDVNVEWEKDDDKTILLNVSIPFGAKASVVVPNTFHITERGNSLDSAKGVRGVVQEAQNLNISIGSGSYRFLMSIKAD